MRRLAPRRRESSKALRRRAAWWLPGAHLQTTWARVSRSRRLVTFQREVLRTDDGDDLVLDHLAGAPGTPRVLLLHGLEGSAHSLHTPGPGAAGCARRLARHGAQLPVVRARSQRLRRRLRNHRPRLYHAGETGDLSFVIGASSQQREPATALYAHRLLAGRQRAVEVAGRGGGGQPDPRGGHHLGALRPGAPAATFLERSVGRFYGPALHEPPQGQERSTCCCGFRARPRTWTRSASARCAPCASSTPT